MNMVNRSLCALAFGLGASFGVSAQEPGASDNDVVATLKNVQGTVVVKRGDASIEVVDGQQLFSADQVLVTEGGRATVVFDESCDVELDEAELYDVPDNSPCFAMWQKVAMTVGAAGAIYAILEDEDEDESASP